MSSTYLNAGLTAAGVNQGTALALSSVANVHQISTCVAGAGVILQSLANGQVVRIRNDGVGYCLVYPPVGGTINSLALNAGFPLYGGQADFISNGSFTYFTLTPNLNASSSTYVSSGLVGNLLVQATATVLGFISGINLISTSTATNNAFILPVMAVGQETRIRNDGASYAQIFPPAGGTINSLATNTALQLVVGGEIDVACTATLTFVILTPNTLNVSLGLTALGLLFNTALALLPLANVHQVGTCTAAANGVSLPVMAIGQQTRIRNDGASYLLVYPPTGGTINSLAVNIPIALAAGGGEMDFVCKSAIGFFTLGTGANVKLIVPNTGGALVWTKGMSGAIVPVTFVAANVTITLPAVANGLSYMLSIAVAGAFTATITAATAVQNASLVVSAGAIIACVAQTSVVFAANAPAGSYYEVTSDGINWYGRGISCIAAGFTTVP